MLDSKDSIVAVDDALPAFPAQGLETKPRLAQLLHEDVNPFSRSFLKLYGCLFVAYLCSATNGVDANTFGEPTPHSHTDESLLIHKMS